jgi:hypothetical protein
MAMASSPEFPDLPWVPSKAWSSGRPYGPPLWIVIHTTEGSEGLKSAEDGAAYDQRRTDGTSTHFFCDQDNTVHCVKTSDRANAARATGNHYGIHLELCGKAAQTPTQWDDPASAGTIRQAAKIAARVARKWDIPVRHLTVAEVRGKTAKGFCAHNDISSAFGESDHSDPGANYPWTDFLTMVRAELEGEDVSFEADQVPVSGVGVAADNTKWTGPNALGDARDRIARTEVKVDKALALLAALSGKDFTDEPAIVQGVLGGLDPATIAAAIPADIARQVADELASRLQGADKLTG